MASVEQVQHLCFFSFRQFVEIMWPAVSADRFQPGLVVDVLCEHLQAVQEGTIKRLGVALPIRHGKSLIISVMWPAWIFLHDPSLRLLTVSTTASVLPIEIRSSLGS